MGDEWKEEKDNECLLKTLSPAPDQGTYKKGPCDLNYMDKLLPIGEGELNVLFGSKILLKGSVKSIKMYNIHANSIMRANVSLIYFLWYLGRSCL